MRKVLGLITLIFFLTAGRASSEIAELALPVNPPQQAGNSGVQKSLTGIELNEKVLNYEFYGTYNSRVLPEDIIYRESYKTVNAIDPKKQNLNTSYYPGLRGPNQLIVYTPAYGLKTGTNEYGTEAIVENNMVVRMNGADSIIPYNGFVISGHGSAKTWITKNIQIGSKVYIDYSNNSIRVYLTPASLVYAAKEKLKEVNGLIEYYKNINIPYNDKKASANLENSKDMLRKAEKKPEKTQEYITEAMESLDKAIKNAIPYYSNELKGVWIRPVEKTEEEIEKTIERISSAGITDIFLETYFHGKTIYPSEFMKNYGVTWQRSEFSDFDPLKIWIKEARKKNIKVHIWFETFYVGNDNPIMTPNHVLNVYPLWTNKRLSSYDSPMPVPSLSEHNGYFLDPANPQVREYLLGILTEIAEKYKPDGINLDYIRYPQTVDSSYSNYAASNWGYTLYARSEFFSLYGSDPIEIKYGTPEWDMWAAYRQNKISSFVMEVNKITKAHNIMLTAVIFPDLRKSKATKMQNWHFWSANNYIDGLTPILLTGDRNTATALLNDVIKNINPDTKLYPGLFVTFMDGPFDELLMQIQKTREFKANGSIIFDYAHLNDVYIEALTTRVFNKSYDEIKSKSGWSLKNPQNYSPEVKYKEKKSKRKSRRK